jgi:nucleotide-binding universal stress UspA family protein
MSTIVVGVDGSKGAIEALRFALDEARHHNSNVKVVNAWHVPPSAYGLGWVPPVDVDSFRKLAGESLDQSLAKAGVDQSGVAVSTEVREGQAADVLCEAARGADLLVVGSRGLGGFRGLLLGSVSQQCAHHAPCPVVVVPNR